MEKLAEYISSDENEEFLDTLANDFFGLNQNEKFVVKNNENVSVSKPSGEKILCKSVEKKHYSKEWTFGYEGNGTKVKHENILFSNPEIKSTIKIANSDNSIKRYISKRKPVETPQNLLENFDIQPKKLLRLVLEESDFPKGSLTRNKAPTKLSLNLKNHTASVSRVRWCDPPYSHLFLSASADHSVQVCDFKQRLLKLDHHSGAVRDAVWADYLIASCAFDHKAILCDPTTRQLLMEFMHEDHPLTCIRHHPDHKNLYVTGSHDTILSLDSRCNKNPVNSFNFKDRMGRILDMCFLSQSELLTSCDIVLKEGADRGLMVWDFRSTAPISNQIFHEKYTSPRVARHPILPHFVAQTQGNYVARFNATPPFKLHKNIQYNKHIVGGWDVGCDVSDDVLVSGDVSGRVLFYNYHTSRLLSIFDLAAHNHQCLTEDDNVVLGISCHPQLPSTYVASTSGGMVAVLN